MFSLEEWECPEGRLGHLEEGKLSQPREQAAESGQTNQFSVEVFQMKIITHLLTTQLKKSISML